MLVGLIVFRLGPVVWSFLLSFQKYNPFQGGSWIGLENYRELIQDKEFHQIFLNTLKFTLWYLPLGVITSLVLAVLVDNRLRGIVLIRAIYFLPVISAVASVPCGCAVDALALSGRQPACEQVTLGQAPAIYEQMSMLRAAGSAAERISARTGMRTASSTSSRSAA